MGRRQCYLAEDVDGLEAERRSLALLHAAHGVGHVQACPLGFQS